MTALGNINIEAIEEYQRVSDRVSFLCEQQRDLEEARESLLGLIADMVKIMRAQFTKHFNIINEYFKETFTELFGGGRAALTLSGDVDEPFSGVEIEVQPPGKALKHILGLSGGEQSLAGIALLFAILRVRPAPFYLLDEIEAALDDANVRRFAAMLRRHAAHTQFIVITHRRGTMEAADTLYGVTMQQKGISECLELRLDTVGG